MKNNFSHSAAGMEVKMLKRYHDKYVDYVIYGGGLAGCKAAVAAARRGYRVALVERRNYLGGDHLENADRPGEMKKELLRELTENGVEVLFGLDACALLMNEEESRTAGLLLCGKWGYFVLEAGCVIDAEVTAPLIRMITGQAWTHGSRATISMRCAMNCSEELLLNKSYIGLDELVRQINMRGQYLTAEETEGADTIAVCIQEQGQEKLLRFTYHVAPEADMGDMTLCGQWAAAQGIRILKKFDKALSLTPQMLGYEAIVSDVNQPDGTDVENLYFLGNASWEECMEEILSAQAAELEEQEEGVQEPSHIKNREIHISYRDCVFFEDTDYDYPKEVRPLPLRKIVFHKSISLPVLQECDVTIAGGGTAGAAAAIAAARSGASTVLVEHHFGLGGTQTYGHICKYYYCYTDGFATQLMSHMTNRGLDNSSIGRMLGYATTAMEEGVTILNGACVCDVESTGRQIEGIVLCRDGQWGRIRSKVVIDATGDGDLLAFSGASHTLGAEADGNMQDSGMIHTGGRGYDLDVIYQAKYQEVLRAVCMAHEFGGGSDFSPLFTPREGRTFVGEYVLDMPDVLLNRHFEDTIAMAYTDNDPHGAMSSLYSRMGIMPYHAQGYMVEVPYRSCIPKGLSGLLIAGKSISATQDAAAFTRMAADVQNRGYALGAAAAMAALDGCDVRDISVKKLQELLKHMQILPAQTVKCIAQGRCEEENRRIYDQIPELLKLASQNDRVSMEKLLSLSGPEAIVQIKKVVSVFTDNETGAEGISQEEESLQLTAALVLAWFGEKSGMKRIKQTLHQMVLRENIDDYDDRHLPAPGNNMGGALESFTDYWKINQLLVVCALNGEAVCEDVETLLNRFTAGGKPIRKDTRYTSERWDLHRIPHHDRMLTLLFYMSKLPDERLAEILAHVYESENLGGYLGKNVSTYVDSDLDLSSIDAALPGSIPGMTLREQLSRAKEPTTGRNYQSAYLELKIGECLAICGNSKGTRILKQGLGDTHYVLRRHAYEQLQNAAKKLV